MMSLAATPRLNRPDHSTLRVLGTASQVSPVATMAAMSVAP